MKYIFLIRFVLPFFLILSFSCSRSNEEKKDEAIHSAKIYLTKKKCDKAMETLLEVGIDIKHAKYMQALSSAYACKSDYLTTVFYGTNLERVASGSADSLIGSLTTFTTSEMTSPTDNNYVYLQNAIDTLIYAGGVTVPSVNERELVFTIGETLDINMQILYMILSQIGKFAYYYGNADPVLGLKGMGSEANGNSNNLTNGCFYDYDPIDPDIALIINTERIAESLGSCTSTATGHPQLVALPNANTVTRMCQGIILFNVFLDLILNIPLPDDVSELTDLTDTFQDVLAGVPGGIGNIITVKSQSECESTYSVGTETDKLQLYFYFIYERLFQ